MIGGAGFVGGELLRLLHQHPEVREITATSRSQAGRPVAEVHPSLAALPASGAEFLDLSSADAARGRDVVFLALEHGESSRMAADVLAVDPGLVVDLAADFRIQSTAIRERYYGPHEAAALQERFRYALADVEGEALRGARALAVPGCFATAAALALWPLAGARLIAPPVLFALTGSSGAGARLRATAHHPTRAHNVFAYGVFSHRHEGEIAERWAAWTGGGPEGNGNARASSPDVASPRLAVHAGPFVRGIYLSLHARLADDGEAPGAARDAAARYATSYEGRPFVRVLDQPPELTHAVGTNLALLHAEAVEEEIAVMVAIDNLLKGASGQAVQAMNLALGFPEDAGLRLAAPFPC